MTKLLHLFVLTLGLALIGLLGCESSPFGTGMADDDVADDDASDDDASDDDVGDDDTAPAEAMVSGEATRTFQTCPPQDNGIGDLCTFIAEVCDDYENVAASGVVEGADMSWPETPVAYEIDGVADGVWQAFGFLDDNESGCEGGPDEGDFFTTSGCVEVEVVGQADVTDVAILFDAKCPADQ